MAMIARLTARTQIMERHRSACSDAMGAPMATAHIRSRLWLKAVSTGTPSWSCCAACRPAGAPHRPASARHAGRYTGLLRACAHDQRLLVQRGGDPSRRQRLPAQDLADALRPDLGEQAVLDLALQGHRNPDGDGLLAAQGGVEQVRDDALRRSGLLPDRVRQDASDRGLG